MPLYANTLFYSLQSNHLGLEAKSPASSVIPSHPNRLLCSNANLDIRWKSGHHDWLVVEPPL